MQFLPGFYLYLSMIMVLVRQVYAMEIISIYIFSVPVLKTKEGYVCFTVVINFLQSRGASSQKRGRQKKGVERRRPVEPRQI